MTITTQWLAPAAAVLGAFGGAWLGNRLSRDSWLRQRRWVNREKYYLDVLAQLKKAELNLTRQSEYFLEPGSEHRDCSDDPEFNRLGRNATAAFYAIEELAGPAEVFLSQKAITALQELVREEWNASYNAGGDRAGYVQNVLSLIGSAQAAIIEAARVQLGSA